MTLTMNHNIMAIQAGGQVNEAFTKLASANRSIASGLLINSAADDPVGLAIRELLRAEGAGLQQGSRNAADAGSLVQTADGAVQGINQLLTRMKELATQSATGTYNPAQREIINAEYQTVATEITRISESTEFNSINLLDGSLTGAHSGTGTDSTGELRMHFGTGNDAAQDFYDLGIPDTSASALGLGNSAGTGIAGTNISTQSSAQAALETIDAAITSTSKISANLGATQNRLESTRGTISVQLENVIAAESRISDADVAEESTKVARAQMLTQSSLEILNEANQTPLLGLKLLSTRV